MSGLQPYQTVTGRFSPANEGDIKPAARQFIGEIGAFQVAWKIDEGPYAGQWALLAPREWSDRQAGTSFKEGFAWVPECDVVPTVTTSTRTD